MSAQSVIMKRDRNCYSCRMFSGFGLICAGAYVFFHAKKFNKLPGVIFMNGVATTLGYLGTARILALPPFDFPFEK